jgi:tRNA (guanosine-2'-O-)-methyltransferase
MFRQQIFCLHHNNMLSNKRTATIQRVARQRQQGIVVLEDIHDPHNAAAVLRSCEAFGIQQVYFIFDQEAKFNPEKIGKAASSSANKWLDFTIFNSAKKCLQNLHRKGFQTYATVITPDARSIFQTQFTRGKIALLFGNEHRGLSETTIKLAQHKLYIPMRGMVQSLNLSVTAAICLYELTRQRQGNHKTGLPKKDQTLLIKQWSK